MDNPVPVSAAPSQDERIMAALSHISLIIPYAGLVVPAVVWITQKDKSRWIRFQALQALAYQVLLMLLWFVGMGCYMASFFSTFAATASNGDGGSFPPFVFLPFLFFGVLILVGFVCVIYAIVAAVAVLTGNDFRYIILGSLVERFLSPSRADRPPLG